MRNRVLLSGLVFCVMVAAGALAAIASGEAPLGLVRSGATVPRDSNASSVPVWTSPFTARRVRCASSEPPPVSRSLAAPASTRTRLLPRLRAPFSTRMAPSSA